VRAPALAAAGRRLKIGYVSTDFRTHPIAHLLTELWERHDRARFEVHAYSIGPMKTARCASDRARVRALSSTSATESAARTTKAYERTASTS
jgi:predicted O-linked N-acetylglucosamine transferase (SPINDLY family)